MINPIFPFKNREFSPQHRWIAESKAGRQRKVISDLYESFAELYSAPLRPIQFHSAQTSSFVKGELEGWRDRRGEGEQGGPK